MTTQNAERWEAKPQLANSVRPSPNFLSTWALALSVPFFWGVAPFVPLLILMPVAVAVSWALARLDAHRCEQVFGKPFAHPALALLTPLLYLLVRLLHDPDLRAGKPLWIALALAPLIFFFEIMAALGSYGMMVHGY